MRVAVLTTDNREHYKDYSNPMPYFGTAPEALLQGFAQIPDLEVHVLSCAQKPMRSAEKLADNIWFHGLRVPRIGWMRTLYAGCSRAFRKELAKIKPDIVHGQGTERDCAIGAVRSGYTNVLTIHGNMGLIARVTRARPLSFPWLAAQLERLTIARANGIVCITHYTQQVVSKSARRTWVVPNAVDSRFFDIQRDDIRGAVPEILCVGLICPLKNQNNFIRALDPLAAQHKFRVVFLGHTLRGRAYDNEFLSLVRERPWCSYGGFADRETLRDHMKKAALLTLPSLEDNCPMVVLEAMASGVPVAVAKVGGLPDLVEHGVTGYFCDPQDAASMRNAIEEALRDPRATGENAARARRRSRERFHPHVVAQQHLRIYREVVQERGS